VTPRAPALIACSLALFLTACATPEWKQASQDCDPEAFRLFPVVRQTERVTEPVVVQVPDGSQTCVSESVRSGDKTTTVSRCTPHLVMQTQWVSRWVTVDLNERERRLWHDRCVSQLCVQRYGNLKCEPSTTKPLPSPSTMPSPP
jgi:hypothetical protein